MQSIGAQERRDNMKTVFVTGADRGIGFALVQEFINHGYCVFGGQFMPEWPQLAELQAEYPDRLYLVPLDVGNTKSVEEAVRITLEHCETLDILVNCAGIGGRAGNDALFDTINVNAIGALRMTELFLPHMEGGMKRLCFVSSEAGSIGVAHREGFSAYPTSKTVLNMGVKLMFNELRPKGYTFRLYHPGWVRSYMQGKKSTMGKYEPEETAAAAYEQFTSLREWEDALVMTDLKGEAWPF